MWAQPDPNTEVDFVPQVMIAMISPGHIVHETTGSLIAITSGRNPNRPKGVILKRSGALIQWARNESTEEFLRTDAEWLLWIDSDIQFPPDLIKRLLEVHYESGALIVGGCYVHPMHERMKPSIFFYRNMPGTGPSMEALHMEDMKSMLEQGQTWTYADGTGAGCLMIHRSVLESMKLKAIEMKDGEPWFTVRVMNGVFYGEDLAFCNRARSMGYKIAVRMDLDLGHVKQIVYKPHEQAVI